MVKSFGGFTTLSKKGEPMNPGLQFFVLNRMAICRNCDYLLDLFCELFDAKLHLPENWHNSYYYYRNFL